MRIYQRIAHACLSGKVDHAVEPMICKQAPGGLDVLEVEPDELKFRKPLKEFKPALFQGRVIIVVYDINTHYRGAFLEQLQTEMKTDEPGCSGYKNWFLILHLGSCS